jgi:O-antigen/teichoic acid export membrane protein
MKQKAKDNLIYLGVAGTVAAALIFYVFYTDRTLGRIPDISGPILWGLLSTPVIVALVLERFWEYRRRRSLWVISIVAAIINMLAMFVAHYFRWNPPLIVWSAMTVLWVTVVLIMVGKFVAHNRSG